MKLDSKFLNAGPIYRFSMLEGLLATVITVIVTIFLVGVFSTSLNTQQKAADLSYSSDSAVNLLRYYAAQAKNDWSILDAFADEAFADTGHVANWRGDPLLKFGNVAITEDQNAVGYYMLEQSAYGEAPSSDPNDDIAYTAEVRLWKELTPFPDGSIDCQMHLEISGPLFKPYKERSIEKFTLGISREPNLVFNVTSSGSGCQLTKYNGMSYSTTLSKIIANGNGTYTITHVISSVDSCGNPAISSISVGTNAGFTNVKINDSAVSVSSISAPFQGFMVAASGIGNCLDGEITLTYTSNSMPDSQVCVAAGGEYNSVSFLDTEFLQVMNGDCGQIQYCCEFANTQITIPGPQNVGSYFCVDFLWCDSNNVTYSLSGAPSWMAINAANQVRGIPDSPGLYTFTIKAQESGSCAVTAVNASILIL